MKKQILLTIVLAGVCGSVARAESSVAQIRCEAPCAWTSSDARGVGGNVAGGTETTDSGTAGMALAGLTLVGMSGLRRKKVVL